MAWTELATSAVEGGELVLYRAEDGVFMIRANGLELMNGHDHRSAEVLGQLAGEHALREARGREPRVLIGGLGLGYTLAGAAAALAGRGTIAVAEISDGVIAWYERYFEPSLFAARPSSVRIVRADVGASIRAAEAASYDAIALDVDNGPEAMVAAGNEHLYGADGLKALGSALTPGGLGLVWSGFEAPAFAARAEAAGFAVGCDRVAIPRRPGLYHYIYRLGRRA